MLAFRADTGEVLHCRQRKGSAHTARGAQWFCRETFGRVRRAGATGRIVLRADSGFCSQYVIKAWVDHDVRYSITVKQTGPMKRAIATIDPDCWELIRHPDPEHPVLHPNGSDHVDDNKDAVGQQAWVTETLLDGRRLIVRRTLDAPTQATLFDTWRYHAFVTDRTGTATELDLDHRRHAVVELAIRDLKNGSGMNHNPSGRFPANSAWLALKHYGPQPHNADSENAKPLTEPSTASWWHLARRSRGPWNDQNERRARQVRRAADGGDETPVDSPSDPVGHTRPSNSAPSNS